MVTQEFQCDKATLLNLICNLELYFFRAWQADREEFGDDNPSTFLHYDLLQMVQELERRILGKESLVNDLGEAAQCDA